MYLGNLPAKTAQALGSISDIVRTEQYMDFINNRRFRSSVLVHEGRSINRNLSLQSFYKFYTCCPLTPSKPWDSIDPHSQTESIKFISSLGNDASVTVSSPILKATFYTYAENYGNPLTIEEILLIAIDKLGGNIKLQDAKIAFEQVLAPLFLNGHMKLFEVKPKCTNQIQDKPKVSNLARYQARDKSKLWVTSQINERIQLNLHDKYIIELMDGEHTISQIEDHIFEKLKDGTLSAFDDQGKIVSDHNMLERLAAESVKMSLETYRTGFLLI
jgi:methyltransferase-like protein